MVDRQALAASGTPESERALGDTGRHLGDTTRLERDTVAAVLVRSRRTQPVLSVVQGHEAGKTVPLVGERLVLGRGRDCDIVLVGRGVSRVHLELTYTDQTCRWSIVDRDSRNGTFVNEREIRSHLLDDDDLIRVGEDTVLKFSMEDETEVAARVETYKAAILDSLTGLLNRRHFLRQLAYHAHAGHRNGKALSVLLFDIDRFKRINDDYGHATGDVVLQRFADCLIEVGRPENCPCRYGGEEFSLVTPGAAGAKARAIADRIRREFAKMRFTHEGETFGVTVSCGIATTSGSELVPITELLREADGNLYRAKREGRNRVVDGTDAGIDAGAASNS